MICKLGSSVYLGHNYLRNNFANRLNSVHRSVETEPALILVSNKPLPTGTTCCNGARLDVCCGWLMILPTLRQEIFDVRVIHPNSWSNAKKPLDRMYYKSQVT